MSIKKMKFKKGLSLFAAGFVLLIWSICYAQDKGNIFVGQDLHLSGVDMSICSDKGFGEGTNVLVFDGGFSMAIGGNKLSSQSAVIFIDTVRTEYAGQIEIDYDCRVYLQKSVSVAQGTLGRSVAIDQLTLEQGEALVAAFYVSGQVFATAQNRLPMSSSDIRHLPLYAEAVHAVSPVRSGPVIAKEAMVPAFVDSSRSALARATGEKSGEMESAESSVTGEPGKKMQAKSTIARQPAKATGVFKTKLPPPLPPRVAAKQQDEVAEEPQFEYPVNLAGIWGVKPEVIRTTAEDGTNIATVIGRFYLWQKKDEMGNLLEFQADNAVIYFTSENPEVVKSDPSQESFSGVEAVYLSGNITMTEGIRTIRASEAYYDFRNKQALAVKVEMRNFDADRGLPVYLRAEQLKQVSETVFHADDIVLTSSEFYLPQVSAKASSIVLTDTTAVDARTGKPSEKSSYDGVLTDMTLNYGKHSIFRWPKMRSNFERPDIPLKSVAIGKDTEMGTSVETRWHLARLLGRKEPDGVESTLALDYFGDRGMGVGADILYENQDYYGGMTGYMLRDSSGEDNLGRNRRDVQTEEEIRGRFQFQHRHFLPYDWQATIEVDYQSDLNFMEWFYRDEFQTAKERETVLHLKRIKDNWGISILNKVRINDFEAVTEELPTIEFHLKGESFWDDKLTFYSDSRVGRLRNRIAPGTGGPGDDEQFYTFASTRNEIDLPFMWNRIKIVPFVAGTFGYEDQAGYAVDIDNNPEPLDDSVWLGEAGVRMSTMFYSQDESIKSRLWDLDGIRHIVKPHLEIVTYSNDDKTASARDVINVGLSQRWQTRRGKKDNLRNLDWMRLDINATWVSDEGDSSIDPQGRYGPSNFIWNNPAMSIFNRRNRAFFGMARDTITADYTWRISDTSTILADANYDTDEGVMQQFNVGLSKYVYPNLSLYLGNRYLRPLIVANGAEFEKGSNSLVAAVSYALNPRYTITFSQEYNFDFGKNVRNKIAILRKYHRMFYAVTISSDQSLDRDAIVFSVWPEGVKELGFGDRGHADLNRLTGGEY